MLPPLVLADATPASVTTGQLSSSTGPSTEVLFSTSASMASIHFTVCAVGQLKKVNNDEDRERRIIQPSRCIALLALLNRKEKLKLLRQIPL